jgi:cytochrome c556
MKANLGAASAKGDLAALASDFRTAVTFAPESEDKAYANWASIAKDGAAAASSGELQASRAACRSCHEQYRAKYKSEVRTRAL